MNFTAGLRPSNGIFADPFQSVELPETIEEFLDDGVAQCVAFNRRGTLLAGMVNAHVRPGFLARCISEHCLIWPI